MKELRQHICEKLKVGKQYTPISSGFKDLVKLYTLWRKRQISKYPEIPLKGIYRTNKIEIPISEENPLHVPYALTKLQIMPLSNESCEVFLIFERTSVIRAHESYTDYDELIERLGNGNYNDGEKIYNSLLEYLQK